ncbi:MAG: DUF424 family protein [Euryarchaeota archaeon]|nr:DUF424 family protein [Euryarchaeota archaeon]
MLRIRLHKCGSDVIAAACDSELAGKTFSEGKVRLKVDEEFYGREDCPEESLERFLSMCTSANLTGGRAVRIAIELGYIDEGCVLTVDGVPHAILVAMR